MATCLTSPYSCNGLARPYAIPQTRRALQVRAQNFGDQGRSTNNVDANMSVLKERIEELKMHERLQRYCRGGEGWNYRPGYDYKLKREAQVSESLYIARLITGTLCFTFLSGTLCLWLVSLLAHLNR